MFDHSVQQIVILVAKVMETSSDKTKIAQISYEKVQSKEIK
jgi:hypothetical protein